MADTFPLTPDYALQLSYKEDGMLRTAARGGKQYMRSAGPPQRVWQCAFLKRPQADWAALDEFASQHADEYFLFVDPRGTRQYAVYFAAAPRESWAANESHDLACDLIEAVDCALTVYPETPLKSLAVSRFVTITTGKLITYPGYGFSLSATGVTDMLIDGVSVGATAPVYNIPLGLHKLEVQPNTASITAFSFVP